MQKFILILCSLLIAFSSGCKRGDQKTADKSLARKYAMYQCAVYKDKELKEWLGTLEKAESVELLGEEKYINRKNIQLDLSRIKLADEKEGYLESKHLGERPIVFILDNVKAYVRPNAGSKVYCTIPKGTIGFIKEEKADWVMVYVGKLSDKFVSAQWVREGFSVEENLVLEAKDLESATGLLREQRPGKMEASQKEAREKLAELAKKTSLIGELAKAKLDELEGRTAPNKAPGPDDNVRQDLPVEKTVQ
jgi:lipoprotein LenA